MHVGMHMLRETLSSLSLSFLLLLKMTVIFVSNYSVANCVLVGAYLKQFIVSNVKFSHGKLKFLSLRKASYSAFTFPMCVFVYLHARSFIHS